MIEPTILGYNLQLYNFWLISMGWTKNVRGETEGKGIEQLIGLY